MTELIIVLMVFLQATSGCHLDDQPIVLCHGLLVEVAGTRSANKDMAVHIQRRPCRQRSRLEQRPGCGYRQAQMANSCCPLS